MPNPRDQDPVIVVGTGIAGCLVALGAAEQGPVIVVTKAELGEGSTRRAQGGIAAALDGGDRWRPTWPTPSAPGRGCATWTRPPGSAGRAPRSSTSSPGAWCSTATAAG